MSPSPCCLVYFVETGNQTPWLIHLLGSALLLGRLCHAFGMSRTPENFRYRVAGIGLTFTVILVSAAHILITALLP
ncbi:MAPEG family protein [Aeromonas veronii]|uniref:MAPEG family protein n=1 Tax=Aeromonas veronii TaxID=654 RepID=UPI0038D2BBF5